MTTEPPGDKASRDVRNRMALEHLKIHFNFDPSGFTEAQMHNFNNAWAAYITTRPKP